MPFEIGHDLATGRPPGSKNKFTTLKEAFREAFDKLQTEDKVNLFEWGKANPDKFYTLISKLFPVELVGKNGEPIQFIVNIGTEDKIKAEEEKKAIEEI